MGLKLLDILGKPLDPHRKEKFDPEGVGYDEKAANVCGLEPDSTGHWPSRCPHTGQLLKGRAHLTWDEMVAEEMASGQHLGRALQQQELILKCPATAALNWHSIFSNTN